MAALLHEDLAVRIQEAEDPGSSLPLGGHPGRAERDIPAVALHAVFRGLDALCQDQLIQRRSAFRSHPDADGVLGERLQAQGALRGVDADGSRLAGDQQET